MRTDSTSRPSRPRAGWCTFGLTALAWLVALPAVAAPACSFHFVGTLSLSFGTLDPSVGKDAVATMLVGTLQSNEVGDCTPANQTMTLTVGNGLNFANGTRNLANGTERIPYTIGGTGAGWSGTGPWTRNKPGSNAWQVIPDLTATILGVNYQNAAAGPYTDTVQLTINP